jgi:hypothetical protein
MHPDLAALADRQGGPFTTAQARVCGYDEDEVARLLRHGAWTRLRRGVYCDAVLLGGLDDRARHVMQLRALFLRLSGAAHVSHASAAVLHGLPLLEPRLDVLHVTRPELAASRVDADVRHHAAGLPDQHLVPAGVEGLPVTTPARTAVDVARESDLPGAVVVCDGILQAGVTWAELDRTLDFCRDWPGARTAGRAVSLADAGAESPGESLTRLACLRGGLPQPQTQAVVRDRSGFVGRVDLLWEEHRTVAEFDGRVKYGVPETGGSGRGDEVLWREKRREDRLREAGYEVVRVVWADLFDARTLSARVRRAFSRSGPRAA